MPQTPAGLHMASATAFLPIESSPSPKGSNLSGGYCLVSFEFLLTKRLGEPKWRCSIIATSARCDPDTSRHSSCYHGLLTLARCANRAPVRHRNSRLQPGPAGRGFPLPCRFPHDDADTRRTLLPVVTPETPRLPGGAFSVVEPNPGTWCEPTGRNLGTAHQWMHQWRRRTLAV